uniref:Tail protein n=1 Tax=viral metagenome TaxID=1070528 RepID=A0A6H1ZEW1_9ZZZZ
MAVNAQSADEILRLAYDATNVALKVNITVLDNKRLKVGTDGDVSLVLNSAGLAANTALANVIIGTPVTNAMAANSLIISNITADGDISIIANDGGNSKTFMFADASAAILYLPQAITFGADNTWSTAQTGMTLTSPTLINSTYNNGSNIDTQHLDGAIYSFRAINTAESTQIVAAVTGNATVANSTFDILKGKLTGALNVGAQNLLFTNCLIKDIGTDYLSIRNDTDTANADLYVNYLRPYSGIVMAAGAHIFGHQGYHEFKETTAPGAGAADTARIYAIVDGLALTDLAAVFQDGTVDIFAQEVTPLDAPTFVNPSGTVLKVMLKKEHAGVVKIVAVFPDGREFDLKHFEYHDPVKIDANKGCDKPIPADWFTETKAEITTRLANTEKVTG